MKVLFQHDQHLSGTADAGLSLSCGADRESRPT